MQHRDQWSHQLGFIAASTGAAIGLGQIWKFPYMAGIHGGGNFVLLYIGLVFLLAVPSFFGEVIIGKLGKKNCVDSMTELAEKYQCTPMWKYLGYLGLLTLFIVCCFYNIAASWSIFFIIKMILGTTITEHTFDQLIASPLLMLGAYMSYTIIVLCIMSLGIQKGIERTCLTFVPVLVGLLLFIVYWSCKLEGFTQAINFLFSFQSTHISTRSILEAAGHALFSLATGAGTALVYGSHLPNKVSLGKATLAIAVTNIFVALIAGLAIFPAVFTFDYSPNMGPELMYKVLPLAFQHLPYGYFFTCIFFVILLIAAITSSVSILEPLVGAASERFTTNRKKSCLFIFAATFVPSTALILSFNVYQDVTFFEQSPFQWIADSLVSVLLCLGTLLFTLFAAWKIPEQDFFIAFGNHKGDSSPGFFTLTARLWLKYFLPVILSALLILSFF